MKNIGEKIFTILAFTPFGILVWTLVSMGGLLVFVGNLRCKTFHKESGKMFFLGLGMAVLLWFAWSEFLPWVAVWLFN